MSEQPPEDHPAASAPVAPPTREAPPAVDHAELERIRAEREQYNRDRELWVAEREQNRQWRRDVEQRLPPPPQPAQPDLDRIWYENPRQAAAMIHQSVVQDIETRYRAEQEELRRQNIMKDFVNGVYQSHPELRGEDHLVSYILQRDAEQIGKAKIPEAQELLARGVREEILRQEKRASEWRTREEGTAPPPAHRATVEGGSASRQPTRTPEEPGAKSITDLIRMRREARDNARHGARRSA